MANIDIVARLQLKAEQFSSEHGRAFAGFETRARTAAQEVRTNFVSSFAEVQKLAQTALVLPRTATGSLDLSSEITQLNASATLMDQRAIALRELSVAQATAANSGRVDAEAMRLESDAAAVASLAEERNAQAIRDRIGALKAVQGELNKTVTATELHSSAGAKSTVSAGQQRAAMQQLGYQMGDVATQFSSGTPPMQIFAQQSSQVVQAVNLMTNSTKGFLGVLAGPWGAVGTAAVIVLVPLVAKMFEMNNALDDAVEKLKKDAAQSDVSRQAKERFKVSIEGVSQAIHEQRDAQLKSIETSKSAAEQDNINAKRQLDRQIVIRQTTALLLEQAVAEFKSSQSIINQSGGGAQYVYAQRLAEAEKAAKLARADLADAEKSRQRSLFDLAAEASKISADPIEQINKKYNDQIAALKLLKLEQIAHGKVVGAVTRQEIDGINAKREAELKAAQDAARKPRVVSLGDQLENEQAARLLTSAKTFTGASESTASGRATLKDLFAQANVNIDPKMVAWCAAFVNSVLATNGLPGTGSLSARSFLGYGESTDKPTKGDIVVSKRGTGAQGHVGFYDGTNAKGDIRVLGGNTGDKVGTQIVKRSEVLGFRKAPTAADSFKAEEVAAKKASEFADKAAEDIARLNAQWGDQPRLIERANLETSKVDALITELQDKKPPNWEQLVADAQALKVAITDGMNRPFNEFIRSQRESLAVQQLSLAGRDVEANALQNALRIQHQQGDLTKDQLADLLQVERTQKAIAEALDDQRRQIGLYLSVVDDAQRSFEGFLTSLKSGKAGAASKGLFKDLLSGFQGLDARIISEKLFGGLDREIEQMLRGKTPIDKANDYLASQATRVGNSMEVLVGAFDSASQRFGANDNGAVESLRTDRVAVMRSFADDADRMVAAALRSATGAGGGDEVVVTANRQAVELSRNSDALMSSRDFYNRLGERFAGRLDSLLGIKLPKALSDQLGSVLQGVSIGSSAGSVFGKGGGQIGGALGGAASLIPGGASALAGASPYIAAYQLGQSIAQPIGKALNLNPTLTKLGLLPGVIGKLFGIGAPVKQGSSTLSFRDEALVAAVATGKGSAEKAQAFNSATSVAEGVSKIAEALNGQISGAGSVSIGYRPGHKAPAYRVDTSGQGKLTGNTILAFDTEEEAIRAAIGEALKDGVVTGISDASRRILQAGGELDAAIQKASLIESIPKLLKERLDPVGAAVDEVTATFDKIFAALKEGGATTEQTAQAQQLYNLELAEAKTKATDAAAGLKSFRDSMVMGSASPLSLRDQEMAAKSALQPFLDQIGSGTSIDQDKYQSAAQTYLDIERQLNGSTSEFFAEFDKIQAATAKAIAFIDNASPITAAADSPAAKATADSAAATAERVQTGNEIAAQSSDQLSAIVSRLDQLIDMGGVDAGQFIGTKRAFGVSG